MAMSTSDELYLTINRTNGWTAGVDAPEMEPETQTSFRCTFHPGARSHVIPGGDLRCDRCKYTRPGKLSKTMGGQR